MTDTPEDPLRRASSRLRDLRQSVDLLERRLHWSHRMQVRSTRLHVLVLVLAVFAMAQIQDVHVESCSPGHRALQIIEEVGKGEVQGLDGILDRVRTEQPRPFCEATFPFHSYDKVRRWPTTWNLVGMAVYATGLGLLLWWTFHRPPFPEDPEDVPSGPRFMGG